MDKPHNEQHILGKIDTNIAIYCNNRECQNKQEDTNTGYTVIENNTGIRYWICSAKCIEEWGNRQW